MPARPSAPKEPSGVPPNVYVVVAVVAFWGFLGWCVAEVL
jgi:hypothetical protein